MAIWTDDPVRDAERCEMSRPRIIGYCPLCQEQILEFENWTAGKGNHKAHTECVQKALKEIEEFLPNL